MQKENNLQKTKWRLQAKKGFTLIELLIVIAIIAIIAAVVFVALDPLTRFQDARDASRWSDITAVLSAIKVDQVDNKGAYIAAVSNLTDGVYYEIGTCAVGAGACVAKTTDDCANLAGLVTEGYIGAIPTDPSAGSAVNTDYYIMRAATGIVTIGACAPEGGNAISVSK